MDHPDEELSLLPRIAPEDLPAGEGPAPGILKLFLGYAPGVGKTYSMLSEAIRRKNRGEDVVIGVIEAHDRPAVAVLAAQIEAIPFRAHDYYGTEFREMDVDAILQRRPQVVLVDELAHTNVEGSRFRKRYEDVLALLASGIHVLSTMNIQHVESLRASVQNLTGIEVTEVVPDWVVRRANEIVLADLTPEALQTRIRRGDVFPNERAELALNNFFRRGNLIALRELALKQVTHAVDRTLNEYVRRKHLGAQWSLQEKIAVCIGHHPASQELIARGAKMAETLQCKFYVIHVALAREETTESVRSLQSNLRFAERLGADIRQLNGKSIPATLSDFVQKERITHVIFGRTKVRGLSQLLYLWALRRFLNSTPHVDVHIITQESE